MSVVRGVEMWYINGESGIITYRETILISGISLNKMKTLIRFLLFRLLEDKTRKLGKTVDHTIASDADFEVSVLLASRKGFGVW